MKNITTFELTDELQRADVGIYTDGEQYYIGLSFEQEPELEEGSSSADISQYPLEDILDEFYVYVSDFCEDFNSQGNAECRLVLAGDDIGDLVKLKSIIGKHVYNAVVQDNGKEYVKLVIE